MEGTNAVEDALLRMFDSQGYQVLAALLALGVGALHAVAPGHGKSITAAYLVGARGTYRDAAGLGLVVAVMHTFSAVVLASAWVAVDAFAALGTQRVTGVLQLLAGLVVVGVGVGLVRRRAAGHGHEHGYGHGHGHGHGHRHGPAGEGHELLLAEAGQEAAPSPWSRRGLVALGLSGGLVPSPTVFLILVTGLLTGRTGFALVLVLLFGLGMALTLTAVGAVTLRGLALVGRASRTSVALERLHARLPVVAGWTVLALGCGYVGLAVLALG